MNDTKKHQDKVYQYMNKLNKEVALRALSHDESKLKSPEVEIFDEYSPKLEKATYGSDEYKQFLKEMKPALDHHYENNSHHPEYHALGVTGMTLVDLLEMICDWKAASERHADGDIEKSIDINKKRFEISDQLTQILRNTVKLL